MATIPAVKVLCPLGCGVDIPVPVLMTSDSATETHTVTVKLEVPPTFTDQMRWHMRRFHGGKDDHPLPMAV